jgi:hypothetical protein
MYDDELSVIFNFNYVDGRWVDPNEKKEDLDEIK